MGRNNVMRKIFLFIFIASVSTTILNAQNFKNSSLKPFKKANTMVVLTNNTDSLNFKQFKRQLLKFDYFISNADADIFTIITMYHELKTRPGWTHSYSYRILFMDGKILIKPYWKAGVKSFMGVNMSDDGFRWGWAKSKVNVGNMIWLETLEMITDYCDCKIIYGEQ